jgi:hypothetical protein
MTRRGCFGFSPADDRRVDEKTGWPEQNATHWRARSIERTEEDAIHHAADRGRIVRYQMARMDRRCAAAADAPFAAAVTRTPALEAATAPSDTCANDPESAAE